MLSRKSLLIFINNMVAYVTGYIGLFFIARFMVRPDYNYGLVSWALGTVGVFAFISTIFGTAHQKRISEGQAEGKCMGTYISLKTASTIVMIGTIFTGLFIWINILGRGFESPIDLNVLYIIILFFALKQIGQVGATTFIAKGMIAKREVIRFMDQTVPTIFIIYVALRGGQAIELAFTYVVGGSLMAITAIYLLREIKIEKPSWDMVRSYWTFGLPSFISSGISQLGNKVDMVLVKLFWGASNVGMY
ncbi:MAG: oligosaccharide flippase family protein, partial [Thermoplasmatota archaeon]